MHTIPFITVFFVLLFQSTGVILAGIGLAAIGFGGKYIIEPRHEISNNVAF